MGFVIAEKVAAQKGEPYRPVGAGGVVRVIGAAVLFAERERERESHIRIKKERREKIKEKNEVCR